MSGPNGRFISIAVVNCTVFYAEYGATLATRPAPIRWTSAYIASRFKVTRPFSLSFVLEASYSVDIYGEKSYGSTM